MIKPLHLALGIGTLGGLLLFTLFPVSTLSPQPAATAYAQSTPSVSFTQEEVQGKEGSTIYLRVKLDTPVTKTTKVTIKLTPDQGTTSRDIPGLTGTKTVTFYKNGTQTKTVAIRTSRTTAEGDKSLTASITKVGNTTVQGDTARVLVKDQKSTNTTPLAGNQNTTATTTPPTNCAQYEGVIPGESRRLNVVRSSIPSYKINTPTYSISPEAQAQYDQMQEDIGWPYGGETDTILSSGNVYVYRFKTTEYNNAVPSFLTIRQGSSVTGPTVNNTGGIMMSFSECPADFTSPAVTKEGPNNSTPCIGMGRVNGDSGGMNFDVAIRGKWSNNEYICLLDENKTYYLNVTAGFSYPGTGEGPSNRATPFIGSHADGTNPEQLISRQKFIKGGPFLIKDDASLEVFEAIKNRSAFYSELRRLKKEMSDAMKRRVEACRARIAESPNRRTGMECASLPIPEAWHK